jgi:hypothetical protein
MGGWINNNDRLKSKQFPSYLPLSLFIDPSTGDFKKENEIVTIKLNNMELENGTKKNLLFKMNLVQNSKYSDKRLGKDIYNALNILSQNYMKEVIKEFGDPDNIEMPLEIKRLVIEYILNCEKKKKIIDNNEDD